jgi:hypothetical protein
MEIWEKVAGFTKAFFGRTEEYQLFGDNYFSSLATIRIPV